jgi:TetR/AcrR family transcriptional repressor of nem operon
MMIVIYDVNVESGGRMKVSRDQFIENRQRILQAASRLFRERGFEQVGVADVMRAAGLTHGGFYGHFKSKDDLIAQAAAGSADKALERWRQIAYADGPGALGALAQFYLSPAHRDRPGGGCLVAALGPEIARQPAPARSAVTQALKRAIGFLETVIPGGSQAARRKQAIATYAGWIGALVLARMADDPAFSEEILAAVADGAMGEGA